ncbi:GGDEF domain-containing protein [Anaerocolumna cellulosilytica]|uniref:GGDEF domain-containing protein n=1 Tax=Anaerocolumna cellulosilytica TaxID=433286 RepID=A0A6S6QZK1_9FIRM|nr:GGDEF domain-containing protein [Anaerocolumna cellulosilytica]MBB5196399.1 diguanylate cyclase (GGDEF)-like protein [Anaerocolumna cellulosilytica]BCJ94479.1 GGDEF domain-containing protein [Anaerocolumna cellulosilytica]
MKLIKNMAGYSLPSLICVLIAYYITTRPELLSDKLMVLEPVSFIILLLGAILAWRFNKSCLFFVLLILAASLFGLFKFDGALGRKNDIYNSLCVLIPINLLLHVFLKERGILSIWGMLRLGLVGVPFYYLYISITEKDWLMLNYFKKKYIVLPAFTKTPLPQLGMFLFIIAMFLLCLRLFYQKSLREIHYLAVLTVAYMALHMKNEIAYLIFFAAAGVICIIAILQATYFMAFYDELTGLPSRRALKQDMMKLGMKYTIAMLDIDFFKKFNDTYGHDTGDEVLKLVASVLQNVSGGGKAYRYGGEEFTLLFPSKSKETAFTHLDELREKISKKGYTYNGKKTSKRKKKVSAGKRTSNRSKKSKRRKQNNVSKTLYVTVSIGAAQRDEKFKNTEAVIKAADEALYRAKKKGRNCVCT